MILVSSICVLFVIYGFLIFFADYIPAKQEKLICATTCLLLIILAGTREVGIDPDSLSYQTSFNHLRSDNLMDKVELSFIIITNALNPIYNDVHLLFFFYAILGVTLKFVAFSRYKESMLLMVLMYISFYYELHETCQIRAGVLSGCSDSCDIAASPVCCPCFFAVPHLKKRECCQQAGNTETCVVDIAVYVIQKP